jgi:hypothetical protein
MGSAQLAEPVMPKHDLHREDQILQERSTRQRTEEYAR